MTKRKITWSGHGGIVSGSGWSLHRSHRGMRQHRRTTAHFTSHHVMDTGDSSHTAKGSQHEARLIPGVDGKRIFGFPNTIITKLRYAAYMSLTGTSGARSLNVFSANGIFDPDITGTGHQPLYRDEYSAIYSNYVVLGSKITVTFMPRTSSVPIIVGIVGDDNTSISTTVETLMEQNNSISHGCGIPGSPIVTLSTTFEPMEQMGWDAKDDGAVVTSTGSNPGDQWCYGVWHASADGSSTSVCDVKVEIDYTIKFSQLLTPTQS